MKIPMLKPAVTKYVDLVPASNGKFVPVARLDIPENTIVEICPVLSISGRAAIVLSKSNQTIGTKLLIDNGVINREFEVFAKLGELELERRLDSGEISEADYQSILRSKVNINSILDAPSNLIPLGNALLYQVSDTPNLIREYHEKDKVCVFKTISYIEQGQELTYSNS